jgi:hypothetical protein
MEMTRSRGNENGVPDGVSRREDMDKRAQALRDNLKRRKAAEAQRMETGKTDESQDAD